MGNVHAATRGICQSLGAQTTGWEDAPLPGGIHPISLAAEVQAGKDEPHSNEAKGS